MLNIYKLYDDKGNLLYIGKTKNIHQRITQHLGEKDSVLWKASIDKIMIADVETEIDLDVQAIPLTSLKDIKISALNALVLEDFIKE